MSIQEAVNSANDYDTIFLTQGVYSQSGIMIDKNITLQGLGQSSDIIIDGKTENSIILINSRSTVKFFNITFINGHGPEYGGAIHSEEGGSVYVENCNFANNSVGTNGGAIDIAGTHFTSKGKQYTYYGYLYANNCTFLNNFAGHDGGALATYWGNSYVYNSVFKYNYATRDGGALRVGIYATTTTENCTFDNNTAYEWGGALYNWPGELTVNNCNITNNNAGTQGGALITSGPLKVTNSRIINNTAKKGGVLYIAEETPHIPSTVIFNNNYISDNTANIASLVYVDETTATTSNFDNNYWDIDPDSPEWESQFITNGLIETPTKWIKQTETAPDINPISPINNSKNINNTENTNNNENTPENNIQQNQITATSINDIINTITATISNSTEKIEKTTIGVNQIQNEEVQSENTAHELSKKNTAKQTAHSPLTYVAIIIILLIILGYGYTKFKKE